MLRITSKIAIGIIFLLSVIGCSPANLGSQALNGSPQVTSGSPSSGASLLPTTITSSQKPAVEQPATSEKPATSAKFKVSSPTESAQPSGSPISELTDSPTAIPSSTEPSSPELLSSDPKRDYGPTTPIPATGRVTLRQNIRRLNLDRLIAPCPADSGPYAFAESTNYRIEICSKEYDPWLPKYYIGQAKDGSGGLRMTATNPDEARQLIFKNGDYTYILYRDSARPERTNAYLEIFLPNGKGYAEALFYLYERSDRPTP